MVDITKGDDEARNARPTDAQVESTMRAWAELQEENKRLLASNEQWEAAHNALLRENESLLRRIADTKHKLGYYQRHSVELATRIGDISRLSAMALDEARQAGYRPQPAGHPREPVAQPQLEQLPQQRDNGEPAPAFLTGRRKREDADTTLEDAVAQAASENVERK